MELVYAEYHLMKAGFALLRQSGQLSNRYLQTSSLIQIDDRTSNDMSLIFANAKPSVVRGAIPPKIEEPTATQ